MTDDQLELEILKRFVAQHKAAGLAGEREKCAAELDMRIVLQELTRMQGDEVTYEAGRWFRLLVRRPSPTGKAAPLRHCSDIGKLRGEHQYHARAFMLPAAAPAWDRIRELEEKLELTRAIARAGEMVSPVADARQARIRLDQARERLTAARQQFEWWTKPGRCDPGSPQWEGVTSAYRSAKDEHDEAREWLAEVQRQEHRSPDIDDVTGLRNRGELDQDLPPSIADCAARGRPLTIAVLDVDYFKDVNDRLGHDMGDAVLGRVAATIQEVVEGKGTTYRMGGGDEIVVVMANSSRPEAEAVLERVRTSVEAIEIAGLGRKITLSIGAATFPEAAANKDSLMRAADRAQMAAKQAGRNQVRFG